MGLLELYPHLAARLSELQRGRQNEQAAGSSDWGSSIQQHSGGRQPERCPPSMAERHLEHQMGQISSSSSSSSSTRPASHSKQQQCAAPQQPACSPARRPAHPGWSHLYYAALVNQVVMMSGQLHADAGNQRHHRYSAHQLALLYVGGTASCVMSGGRHARRKAAAGWRRQ
jgi:hypothetical protein